jgi:hypothetical protein
VLKPVGIGEGIVIDKGEDRSSGVPNPRVASARHARRVLIEHHTCIGELGVRALE